MPDNQCDIFVLEIINLNCGYGSENVIKDFNLRIRRSEIVAIIGMNGSGKSTLLKAIYQLCVINGGTIKYKECKLNNRNPEEIKEMGIAYFRQKDAIFEKLTVIENLYIALSGVISKKIKQEKIKKICEEFPLISTMLNKTAGLLSGGQRQQLSMAMLVIQDADLWLLDEPTAGLDAENTNYFIELLNKYKQQKTILLVEHKKNVIDKLTKNIIEIKLE